MGLLGEDAGDEIARRASECSQESPLAGASCLSGDESARLRIRIARFKLGRLELRSRRLDRPILGRRAAAGTR